MTENIENTNPESKEIESKETEPKEVESKETKTTEPKETKPKEIKTTESKESNPIPKEYEFDFANNEEFKDIAELLDLDDPELQAMIPIFNQAGINQEQANLLVGNFLKTRESQLPNPQEEMEKLGKDRDLILNKFDNLASKLNETDRKTLEDLTMDAKSTEFLHRILFNQNEKSIPIESGKDSAKSYSELMNEAMDMKAKYGDEMLADSNLQEKYDSLIMKASKII